MAPVAVVTAPVVREKSIAVSKIHYEADAFLKWRASALFSVCTVGRDVI